VTQFAARSCRGGRRAAHVIFATVIAECNLVVSWRARPRGFVALMGLYESNYLRLAQLAGDLRALPANCVSRVAGDCTLLLNVYERARYTSELLLTYLLPSTHVPTVLERVPDLRLRLYHDARLLEARGGAGVSPERELHRCWNRNMMVNKWLEYCAERGHGFVRSALDCPTS
jgi:uncharacterized protein YqiB (DUF1249 family)